MIKNLIGPGIGFSPGKVKFIVTRGLSSLIGAFVPKLDVNATDFAVNGLAASDSALTSLAVSDAAPFSVVIGDSTR